MFKTAATTSDSNDVNNTALSTVVVQREALETIFFLAASAEYGSEHPLAKGIISKAAEMDIGKGLSRPLEPVNDFTNEPGKGIHCTILGHRVHIGNRKSLATNNIKLSPGTGDAMEYLEHKGQTAVVVSVDGQSEAVIGLIDKAKSEASLAVKVLQKKLGVKVYMLTGDNIRTAKAVGADIGIHPSQIIADVLPEGKVDCIKKLQKEHKHGVAMVGDGINDSPALAQADIGIAVGAGTNVAIETAGIVLVNSKLTDVVVAMDLTKTIYRRINLNFIWALGYNTFAIPIAAGALYPVLHQALPPFIAGVAMVLSSMNVLLSSLLLNRYKPPKFYNELGRNKTKSIVGDRDDDEEDAVTGYHEMAEPLIKSMDRDLYPGCSSSWGKACCCHPGKCLCGKDCNLDEEDDIDT
jgi:Cu+-exporting ATPase